MYFLTIRPDKCSLEVVSFPDPRDAVRHIGIDPMRTDHGTLRGYAAMLTASKEYPKGLSLIVYEMGLLEKHWEHFFGLKGELYSGSAVVYAFDGSGDTCDIPPEDVEWVRDNISFFGSRLVAEAAINMGVVNRPQQSITTFKDGKAITEVMWEWKP